MLNDVSLKTAIGRRDFPLEMSPHCRFFNIRMSGSKERKLNLRGDYGRYEIVEDRDVNFDTESGMYKYK